MKNFTKQVQNTIGLNDLFNESKKLEIIGFDLKRN